LANKKKADRRSRLYQLPRVHRPPKDLISITKKAGLAALRAVGSNINVAATIRNNWNLRGFIVLCFSIAGMASLMDQVLWMRQLGLIFGTTMEAVSTVLAVFMAGLALGSYLFGKMADKTKNPLRLYAILQMGIGAYVMLTPLIFSGLNAAQVSIYGSLPVGSAGVTILRVMLSFLVLIVPTTLMGGTLPVIGKFFVRKEEELGGGIGNLYFINTLGAVLGAFLAGFVLIPYLGVLASTFLAASLDFAIGVGFYFLQKYKIKPVEQPPPEEEVVEEVPVQPQLSKKQLKRQERDERKRARFAPPAYSRAMKWVVLVGFGFGGLASLSLEVSWTRVLSMVLGSSVYAFSLMLTAFLLGIALGSAIVSKFVDRARHLWIYFFVVEVLIGIAVVVLNPLLGELPLLFVRVFPSLQANFWLLQFVEFLLLLLIMLVPTMLMGAAFPIAAKIYTDDLEHLGGSVGRLYAGNTFGSMIGPLLTGFVIIPLIGIQWSVSLVSIIYMAIAGAVFIVGFKDRLKVPDMAPLRAFVAANVRPAPILKGIQMTPRLVMSALIHPIRSASGVSKGIAKISVGLAGVTVLAVLIVNILIPILGAWDKTILNSGVFLYSENYYEGTGSLNETMTLGGGQLVYYDEGLMATVAVYDDIDGDRALTVDGKVDATTFGDLSTELLSGHLPMLMHDDPEKVLLIGVGSGITLGAVELYPSLVNVEAVEIESAVVEAARDYFNQANGDALNHPKLKMIQADARNYVLAQTKKDTKYDVITAEPSNPWMAGNSNLFTREQFELYEQILDDDGVICQWIHYYSMSLNDLKTVLATFTGVFPNTTLWRTGGDLLMVGTEGEQSLDFTALNIRLQQEDVHADLRRMEVNDIYDVLGRFVMGPTALAEYCEDAPIHTDNHPILQFSAPKSLHSDTVLDNAQSLQSSTERIEDVDSFLVNYEAEVNFATEIQKQIGFYIHYTDVIYNEQYALASQQKALAIQQKRLASQQKALASQEKGDYAAAIEYDNEAAEYANEEAAHTNIAFGYASDALAANEAVLGTGARDAYAHRRLGEIYKKRFLDGGMDAQDLDKAFTHLKQSVALNPTYAPTWIELGGIYLVMEQLQEAIDSYSNAINLAEDNVFLYNLRGQIKLQTGDYNGAIADFNRIIMLQPAFAEAWFLRAGAYLEMALDAEDEAEKTAELDKALSDANRALNLDSNQAVPYYVRGRVYYEWGEQTGNRQYYSRAVAEQKRAIGINFNLAYSHLSLGMAYAALGGKDNYSGAWNEMTTATALNGDYAAAWYELGRFEPRMAEYFPGMDWVESAIERFATVYDIGLSPDSEIMQNTLDALDELMDWDNLSEIDLTHLGLIYEAVPDTDVSEKIPDAVDAIMNWDNITEDDREALTTIVQYMSTTAVGQKAQDAIDVLGPVS